ncbi:MAG: ABC transporter permease [Myxococcota bacterium]
MTEFLVRRSLSAIFVLWASITLVFVVMFGFGDPCAGTKGAQATPEQLSQCREAYGLDQPLIVQYASYLGVRPTVVRKSSEYSENAPRGLLQGHLGISMLHDDDVTTVVLTRLPRTMLLGGMALSFEVIIGVIIGIVAATRRNTWFDTGFMATAFLGISAPSFLTGLVFLYFFAFRLGWFPVGGYGVDPLDHVGHAVLPAFTLAIIGIATYARIMRSEMIDTLRTDYIRTARAKGVGPFRVILAHGARNALLPIVTLMGLQLAILVSGAIITEEIFSWPGVGRLALESIVNQDAFMVVGLVVMVSLTVQVGNILADIVVATLDPRIRLGSK